MRWCASCVLVLVGCSFHASPATGTADAAIDSPGVPSASPDAKIDAPPVQTAAFCDPSDQGIMVCFDFDDGTANDKSSHHLTVHTANLNYTAGEVSQALQFSATSAADIDNDDSVFDVSSITIEAWINPDALPGNMANVLDVLDVNGQYAIQVKKDGTLNCILGDTGAVLNGPTDISPHHWSHVACTYDGSTGDAFLYLNGGGLNSDHGQHPLATKGNSGFSLGADNSPPPLPIDRQRFVGLLDQVRLTNRVRTGHEICLDAGQTNCE
jgi:hypothetical protein